MRSAAYVIKTYLSVCPSVTVFDTSNDPQCYFTCCYISRVVTCVCLSVCLSLATYPHCCTDPDITWGNDRGCPLVVYFWADLQSVHGFRCYDNIIVEREMSASACSLVVVTMLFLLLSYPTYYRIVVVVPFRKLRCVDSGQASLVYIRYITVVYGGVPCAVRYSSALSCLLAAGNL